VTAVVKPFDESMLLDAIEPARIQRLRSIAARIGARNIS